MSAARLELSRSWTLSTVIVALHAGAGASLLSAIDGWPGIALGAALLALGVAAAWARALHGSAASVRALELSGNAMLLELRDGRRCPVELGASRHVGRFMVTLPVRRPMRRTILVTRDMLSPEDFRRLRLWTLWGKLPVAAAQLPA